ncbi:hypothetical protein ACFTWS_33415 [Streptomyces sp. NPDC057027]|uniref:hypothetical protein n=1 Tax=Streptomyces sp. NPDC057027 TaxID=3346004 RepID=UPI00362E7B78
MPENDVTARLDQIERVLGLQKLTAANIPDELLRAAGGMSSQSIGCHSGISLFCLGREAQQ